MSNMFHHQLGFEPHGYSIENAGPSLFQGAGLKQDFISLGQGFSDMGRYISKSVAFLTFASVVRAVVDVGVAYVTVMSCMMIVVLLFLWNLKLQTCLAHLRTGQAQAQSEAQRADNAAARACRLEAELEGAHESLSAVTAEFKACQEKQQSTERQLEDARIMLFKMSNEITRSQGNQQSMERELAEAQALSQSSSCNETSGRARGKRHEPDSGAGISFPFLNAEKGAEELGKAYQKLGKMFTDAVGGFVDADPRGERTKRRRSV